MKDKDNEIKTGEFLFIHDLENIVDTMFSYINRDEYKINYAMHRSVWDDKQDKICGASKIARDGMNKLVDRLNLKYKRELDDMKWRITTLEEKLKCEQNDSYSDRKEISDILHEHETNKK